MLSCEELERYSRHIFLPGIGVAGQEKLKASRVFVVGTGGLGSPVLLYLAAAGVGHIAFADDDRIELTNLQRQILYQTNDLGKAKVHLAKKALEKLNPHIEYQPLESKLTKENVQGYLKGYDLVIETSDHFPTKFLINDHCIEQQIPLIIGGILRFEGQVFSVGKSSNRPTPCYRCIFSDVPPQEQLPDCSQAGVFGATAGLIGSMQASIALRILTKLGPSPYGEMYIFDLLHGKIRNLSLPKNLNCQICA